MSLKIFCLIKFEPIFSSTDSAVTGLPVSGIEEKGDIEFFTTYSLPLIKLAIFEYLKLDTVEVPTTANVIGAVGGSWDNNKVAC